MEWPTLQPAPAQTSALPLSCNPLSGGRTSERPGENLAPELQDHHIKRGNAIVGFVRQDEMDKGVPDEAFVTMPGDDKEIDAIWRKTNMQDRKDTRQMRLAPAVQQRLEGRLTRWNELSALPERTPADIDAKKERFCEFSESSDAFLLTQIAAIPIAQFYVPRTFDNNSRHVTDAEFRRYWIDGLTRRARAPRKTRIHNTSVSDPTPVERRTVVYTFTKLCKLP